MAAIRELFVYDRVRESAPSKDTLRDLLQERSDGIRLFEARVRLKASLEAYPDHDFLGYLYGAVGFVDQQMDAYPEKLTDLFSEKYPEREVKDQQRQYISEFQKILSNPACNKENVVISAPLYGALPILDELKVTLGDKLDVLPAWISGTTGASTGEAQVVKPLDGRLLDEKRTVIFADDVTDSCVSLASLALERQKKRTGKVDTIYAIMMEKMRQLKDERREYTDPEYAVLYSQLVGLLEQEHIVLAPFYNKNQPMLEAINERARNIGTVRPSIWTYLQQEFSSVAVSIGQHEWIMGGQGGWSQPLLDTGINGAHEKNTAGMLDFIDQKYHTQLIVVGFDKLYLRMGAGIKGLRVFRKDQYENLVQIMANFVTAYMEKTYEGMQ